MEEIICPECGRPNLNEAVRCWYCQKEFEKKNNSIEFGQGSEPGYETKSTNFPDPGSGEEVPEWLSRIRELKKEDEELEEQQESWQQEALFSSKANADKLEGKEKTRKTIKAKHSTKKFSVKKQFGAKAGESQRGLEEKEHDRSPEQKENKAENVSTDELPEGFKPLSHNNNSEQTDR